MNKDKHVVMSGIDIVCLIMIAFAWCFYIKGIYERFSIGNVTAYPCLVVMIIVGVIALSLYACKSDRRDIGLIPMFMVLFLVYSLRAPDDLLGTYLWAEDGCVLLQNAINDGVKVLITPTSGTYWTIQKFIGLICYWICYCFKNLMFFPALESIFTKIVASLGVSYFLSNRFNWLIESRTLRFIVCIVVILAIPFYATDVITCDTSLPFVLNFTVFLIGLDTLCRPESRVVSYKETIFLCLQALSTAAAPFVALVTGLSFVRWMYMKIRTKDIRAKLVLIELLKTGIICICVLIQVMCALGSSRVNGDLGLFQRLVTCIKDFVLFPYAYTFENMKLFLIAVLAFACLALLTKMPWKVLSYSIIFSYCFLIYCSMIVDPDSITYQIFREANGGARYIMILYMIAAFVLCIEICRLWMDQSIKKVAGIVLFVTAMIVSVLTYSLPIMGYEYIEAYHDSIGTYNPDGKEVLIINVAPWYSYGVSVPCSISDVSLGQSGSVQYSLESINNQSAMCFSIQEGDYIPVEGWAISPEGDCFEYLFIERDDGSFLAPMQIDSLDNSFVFYVHECDLTGNVLQFVGLTNSGERYCWNADICMSYQ